MPRVPLPVVCAIISDAQGQILVAQRPAHKHLGLKWEFPGGKIESRELAADALVREIREELGCEIVVSRALPAFTHDYGDVVIEMFPFVCALAPGSAQPHPHEHLALAWLEPAALATIDLAPADIPIVGTLAR